MRITDKMLTRTYLSDLSNNLENMRKLQEQMSTGREINRPSDDPFKYARSLELNSSITANERYGSNIDEGTEWLKTTDSTLGELNTVLQRARELTVQASNGTESITERNSIEQEISQLKDEAMQICNTTFNGKYIFGGDKTIVQPFEKDASGNVLYKGSTTGRKIEFTQGVIMDIATLGSDIAPVEHDINGNQVESGIFKVLSNIETDLNNNVSPGDNLDGLDKNINNIINLRAVAGAKENRLDSMKTKNDDENLNMTELLSKTEDIDVAQKYTEYSTAENVYTSCLKAGAKILQPSLLDFLS